MTRLPLAILLVLLFVGAPARADDGDWKRVRKNFKKDQKHADWRVRKDAYAELSYFDTAASVKEVLSAFAKEKNPAAVLGGIQVLAGFKSAEAQAAVAQALKKGKGNNRLYVLMALERQKGAAGQELLLEVLRGKDSMAAAQAALALGKKRIVEAIPDLKALALSKQWQLRSAAAQALQEVRATDALPVLAKSLAMSGGSERRFIVRALQELTGEKFGADSAAWAKLAAGTPGDQITPKAIKLPHAFQIPIYGRRVVFIMTNSQRNENPHRFKTGERLEELCQVPGSRPILHTRLVTVGHFIRAHAKRLLADLPSGSMYQLLIFNSNVSSVFPKLTSVNSSMRKVVGEAVDGVVPAAGMNHYDALIEALNAAGPKDSAAWSKGPDEIVFTVCNTPNKGEITEPDVVAASIAFKARMRMVPIHTIGVESHSYDMLQAIADQTGGVYRNLYE